MTIHLDYRISTSKIDVLLILLEGDSSVDEEEPLYCSEPEAIYNGGYEGKGESWDSYEVGTTIQYFCDDGYAPVNPDNDEMRCVRAASTAYWVGKTLECRLAPSYGKFSTVLM